MYTIRAVAVGNFPDTDFTTPRPTLKGVRPYIKGLINWLENQPNPPEPDNPLNKYSIGPDYVIEYRERDVGTLSGAFSSDASLFFCMSTTVGDAAVKYTQDHTLSTPIVVITSDPSHFPQRNVCGVSALRPQLVDSSFHKFKKADKSLKTIYALHRVGYAPSELAKQGLGSKVTVVPVQDTQSLANAIDPLTKDDQHGLLVLPADRFFGAADEIVNLADKKNLKSFWSVPDWPTGAFGGYGYPQEVCGQYMAERVASIWSNKNQIPDPPFVTVDPDWIKVTPKPTRKKAGQRSLKGKKSRKK